MCQITTRSPALIAWPRISVSVVAVRRKCSTGDAQRRTSSTASAMRASGSLLSSSNCSGWVRNAYMPCAVALRVVSLPATASSSMNMSNSSSLSCSPSISALSSLVTMSSRGSSATYRGELVRVGEELDERALLVVVLVLGVAGADHAVGPFEQLAAVLLRHAHDLGDRLEGQLGRDVLDEVGRIRSRSRCRRSAAARCCSACSMRPIMRGVKPLFTSSR